MDEIKPDYCFISKANMAAGLPDYQTCIQVYEIITPKSHISEGFSRLVLLAREGSQFTVDKHRMHSEIASI